VKGQHGQFESQSFFTGPKLAGIALTSQVDFCPQNLPGRQRHVKKHVTFPAKQFPAQWRTRPRKRSKYQKSLG